MRTRHGNRASGIAPPLRAALITIMMDWSPRKTLPPGVFRRLFFLLLAFIVLNYLLIGRASLWIGFFIFYGIWMAVILLWLLLLYDPRTRKLRRRGRKSHSN
jgi:hypothetical protein